MFWQVAELVATVRKPLFGKQLQRYMEHFLPHPTPPHLVLPLEADEHCGEIRLIAVSALIP